MHCYNNSMEEYMRKIFISTKEYEVLKLLVLGFENSEISKMLYIATSTVKSHISSLLRKFNARNRTHLVINSLLCEIFTLDEFKSAIKG